MRILKPEALAVGNVSVTWNPAAGDLGTREASALPTGSPGTGDGTNRVVDDRPVRRPEAALQLVQDRIRYVYIGMDGGNFRPATTEETWTRRFRGCKAKTALLLAILRDWRSGRTMLVNSPGGRRLNERLPPPGLFDHVVVRAPIGGALHWLDGPRSGDTSLRALLPPIYRGVLPLRAGAADLEAVASTDPRATVDHRGGDRCPGRASRAVCR